MVDRGVATSFSMSSSRPAVRRWTGFHASTGDGGAACANGDANAGDGAAWCVWSVRGGGPWRLPVWCVWRGT